MIYLLGYIGSILLANVLIATFGVWLLVTRIRAVWL